jgi:hypothetical protein
MSELSALFALLFTSIGFTPSINSVSSDIFGFVRILLISSSSEADLITTPLFFLGEDVVGLTGFISMAMASFQEPIFERGSLSRKMLGTEVKQGTYDYLCILHPWMTGSVIVT